MRAGGISAPFKIIPPRAGGIVSSTIGAGGSYFARANGQVSAPLSSEIEPFQPAFNRTTDERSFELSEAVVSIFVFFY